LYNLLQLRSEVFIVEQDCVYQDIDGKDQNALHVLGIKNNKIVAYTRIFKPGDYYNEAAIGRVVVHPDHRKDGLGYALMKGSITQIESLFQTKKIKIGAQTYLKNFYESLGFQKVGKDYLEDGIPHIYMKKS
jgi:ElaA protein